MKIAQKTLEKLITEEISDCLKEQEILDELVDPVTGAIGIVVLGLLGLSRKGPVNYNINVNGEGNIVTPVNYQPTKFALSAIGADSLLQMIALFMLGKISNPAVKEKISNFVDSLKNKSPEKYEKLIQAAGNSLKDSQQEKRQLLLNPAVEAEAITVLDDLENKLLAPAASSKEEIVSYVKDSTEELGRTVFNLIPKEGEEKEQQSKDTITIKEQTESLTGPLSIVQGYAGSKSERQVLVLQDGNKKIEIDFGLGSQNIINSLNGKNVTIRILDQ